MKTLIIGAGMTGLANGIKTGATIYEASDKPGGICRSYYKDGFRFENGGGHWLFGSVKVKEFLEQYSDLNYYTRRASVHISDSYEYPIQHYFQTSETTEPGTLKHWLLERFGNDLCRLFFYPFNNKYTDGLYEKVIQDDPAKSPGANSNGYNDRFCYPVGGLDKLVDKMAAKCSIKYNKRLIKIEPVNRVATFEDRTTESYERLISTIPLKEMMRICGKPVDDLPHTSVLVLNVGAEIGPDCPKDHWVYVPGKEDFFRVQFYSNVDQAFAPKGMVGLCVEKAFFHSSPSEGYIDHILYRLEKLGWIGKVKTWDASWVPYGYTWLYPHSKREQYISYLKDNGIDSIGRYGKWKFQGVAESIQDGLKA
jgi:protoporphyrinogen oxidase